MSQLSEMSLLLIFFFLQSYFSFNQFSLSIQNAIRETFFSLDVQMLKRTSLQIQSIRRLITAPTCSRLTQDILPDRRVSNPNMTLHRFHDGNWTKGRVLLLRRVQACHLDVGRVLGGILDLWEPVFGRFGEVFGLCDEPQHLGPTWAPKTKTETL